MARTGRPKGYPRSGGRKKGTPNKATAERQEMIRRHLGDTKASRPLAKDVLAEMMMLARGMVAKYQPGSKEQPNPNANELNFEKWLKTAGALAKDLADYESPKLASTTLRGDNEQPIRAYVEVEYVN